MKIGTRWSVRSLALLTVLSFYPFALGAQSGPPAISASDRILGRVVTDSGLPIEGAHVIAAPSWSRQFQETSTDSAGRYLLAFSPGTGDYIVTVAAPNRKGFKRRIARVGHDSLFTLDVVLLPTIQQLAAVQVRAVQREVPFLRPPFITDVGGAENIPTDYPGAIGNDGDLASLAASIPGITFVPGTDGGPATISILGQGPSQSSTTLNGLHADGAQIPAQALAARRVMTSAFDPTVGGFSGALTTVFLTPGTNLVRGNAGLRLDAPALQWSDHVGRAFSPPPTDVQLSAGRAGAFVRDKVFYNVAAQVQRRSTEARSLLSLDPSDVQALGVSLAARDTFLATVRGLGVPTDAGLGAVTRRSGSVLARVDFAPSSESAYGILGSADWSDTGPIGVSPSALPTARGAMSTARGGMQAEYARYIEDVYALRVQSGITVGRHGSSQSIALPGAAVLAASASSDEALPLTTLRFGGSGRLPSETQSWNWQSVLETSWYSPNNSHHPKLALGTDLADLGSQPVGGRLGTFSYQSLAALAQNRPSAFNRTLSGGDWHAREASASLGVGDVWRVSPRFSIQYGARTEANHFLTAPTYNAVLDTLFGRSTAAVPNSFHVSPRVGFNLAYGQEGQVNNAPRPRGFLFGGVGEFRSDLPVSTIGSALAGTGLPEALRTVRCVGDASPIPDWSSYVSGSAPPSSCLAGNPGFGSAQPEVTLYDPAYEPARSWRATLGSNRRVFRDFRIIAQALASLNLAQASAMDLNFTGAPAFGMIAEEGRPIYATSTQIDPTSGGVAPDAARRSTRFGSVTSLTSDLRSESGQLMASIFPYMGFAALRTWSLNYAYARVRDQARGFDGVTAGDPRVATWGTSVGDVRHTVSGMYTEPFTDDISLTVGVQARSGVPYSPRVDGDVNGDGRWNDLAFVPNPSNTPDAATAAAMSALLARAPDGARTCLLAQLGTIAARNSCRGPWTTTSWLRLSMSGYPLGGSDRARISFLVSNPVAGADLLLHGSNRLHGWGQPAVPDPTLLTITGFDANSQRYRYAVNPRFGDTHLATSPYRTPFQLTLQATVPIGPSTQQQNVSNVVLPGRGRAGPVLTAAQTLRMIGGNRYYDVVPILYAAKDSLYFTTEQVARLNSVGNTYLKARDSIWTAASAELAKMGAVPDQVAARAVFRAATTEVFERLLLAARDIREMLAPEQLDLMGQDIRALLDDRSLRHIRSVELRAY